MSSFRTSSVFKFTRDYKLLKKIIRDGIIPNYCEEDLSFDKTKFVVGIPMASFCDIPISLLDEHIERYGKYGIALSKDWAIKRGLTPVMYIANNDVIEAIHFHYDKNTKMINMCRRYIGVINNALSNDVQFQKIIELAGAKHEHLLNTHIIGYLKKYEGVYRGKPINNYEENEWRFLVPDRVGTKWFWTRQAYTKWRFPNGNKDTDKPSPSKELKKYTLKYDLKDISYILIKDEEYKARLITFIKKLKKIGGNPVENEAQKDDLISRIITLDQVKNDF